MDGIWLFKNEGADLFSQAIAVLDLVLCSQLAGFDRGTSISLRNCSEPHDLDIRGVCTG